MVPGVPEYADTCCITLGKAERTWRRTLASLWYRDQKPAPLCARMALLPDAGKTLP